VTLAPLLPGQPCLPGHVRRGHARVGGPTTAPRDTLGSLDSTLLAVMGGWGRHTLGIRILGGWEMVSGEPRGVCLIFFSLKTVNFFKLVFLRVFQHTYTPNLKSQEL